MTITCEAPATLETETCGRCGGSGKFSYNLMHGDRCYGCSGKGIRYTKRGAAAAKFLDDLRRVRLDSLKVGDLMQVESCTPYGTIYRYFGVVTQIKQDAASSKHFDFATGEWIAEERIEVVTTHAKFGESGFNAFPNTMVRKGFSSEEKAEQFKQALAYQATLTKAGKPRKGGK
jgi:hypothetical protein